MNTVITIEIDGYEIVQGFSTLQIDPEATKKVVNPLLDDTDEVKAVTAKQSEMQNVLKAKQDSARSAKVAYQNGDTSKHAKHSYDVELRTEQLSTLSGELQESLSAVVEKKKEIWNENKIYFEPRAGETAISDEDHTTLAQAFIDLEDGYQLDVSGNKIIDKRGTKYVKDGKILEVTKLGEDIDGLLLSEVTAEEFEVMRIENLTTEELEVEIETNKKSLLSKANTMRGELEITGDPDALAKSQAWYQEQLQLLEAKYTIA